MEIQEFFAIPEKRIPLRQGASQPKSGAGWPAQVDPTSLIVRFFSAEFGQPAPGATKVEHWLDVLKEAEVIEGEGQGTHMRYCSATTTVLNYA